MNKPAILPPELMPEPGPLRGGLPPNLVDLPHEETPEFLEYWRAIMLRKWAILALAVLFGIIAYVTVAQVAPVFRSTATLLIETTRPKLVPTDDGASGEGYYYREFVQTQVEMLKSRDVAQRVVTRLGLVEHPEFDPRQRKPSGLEKWVGENFPAWSTLFWKPPGVFDEAGLEAAATARVAGGLAIEPVRMTQLIRVSFEAHDPALAAKVANATAQSYIEADLDTRYKINQNAGELINERLADLKTKLDASEKALQSYREREGLLDNKSTVLSGTGRQLDDFTQKLVDARVRRSEAEQAYNQVKAGESAKYDSVPAVVRSPSVQRAKEVEAEADKKLAEVSQRYGPDHPRHVAAASDLAAARANTARQIQVIVASVVKEYEAARATERTIEEALGQSKGAIQSLNRKEIQLGVLEREAATNRQLYQSFLTRFKETSATKDAQQSSARLIDAAVATSSPIRPDKQRTVLIGVGAGLLLGVLGTLLLKSLDNTVKTSDDVEKKLRQPFLAALPVLSAKDRKGAGCVVLDHPHDVYAEAIRTASTGVLLSALDTPRKVVVITSSVPSEGKSTFAMNLGFSQAKTKRVLLIEGDMRRPCYNKALNMPPEQKGLSELVSDAGTLEECVVQVGATELHVIAAGHIPPNPLELLVSQRFRDLLANLRDRYDMVIIDSPPVQLVSDALVIGSQATGIIYVVKADDTPAPLARVGLKRIAAANISIFGVVLNQQDIKKAEKYYGEYSGYGKYGYRAAYGAKEGARS